MALSIGLGGANATRCRTGRAVCYFTVKQQLLVPRRQGCSLLRATHDDASDRPSAQQVPSHSRIIKAPEGGGAGSAVLQRAEATLSALEARAGPDHIAHIQQLHAWLHARISELRSACDLNNPGACSSLDKLEGTVRQLEDCGTNALVTTLSALVRAEERRAAAVDANHDREHEAALAAVSAQRQRLHDMLADIASRSPNGRITALDLQDALPRLTGHTLDDDDLSMVVRSLEGEDMHFGLTPEEATALISSAMGDPGSSSLWHHVGVGRETDSAVLHHLGHQPPHAPQPKRSGGTY